LQFRESSQDANFHPPVFVSIYFMTHKPVHKAKEVLGFRV